MQLSFEYFISQYSYSNSVAILQYQETVEDFHREWIKEGDLRCALSVFT